jgi:hypothetical protein
MQDLKRIRNSKEAAYKNQPRRRGLLADQVAFEFDESRLRRIYEGGQSRYA